MCFILSFERSKWEPFGGLNTPPLKKVKEKRPNHGVKAGSASNDYRSPGENKCVSGVRND